MKPKRFKVSFEAEDWSIRTGSVEVEAEDEVSARNKAMDLVLGGELDGKWDGAAPEDRVTKRIDDVDCEEL